MPGELVIVAKRIGNCQRRMYRSGACHNAESSHRLCSRPSAGWPSRPSFARRTRMRSGNPALSESTFLDLASGSVVTSPDQAMTLNGTVNKTGFLLLLTVLTAAFAWNQTIGDYGQVLPGARLYAMGGAIGGLVLALITVFKKEWSPVTAPMYALVEGLFLGAISAVFNAKFPGIVFQAVLLTFGTLFALLFAYRSGLIKATENFKMGVVAATGGIALLYLASFVLGFFNIDVPVIHDSSWLGIAFSLFVVVVAALNLVLDFDFIETGVAQRAPKYMEWYGAFGLMVTLVWLYVEFLRLLSKIQQR
ncbi:Bax inhibitor-1/YccA family protein [Stenotrophomonas geniculata]|nr:Bax inhibitor-1/YccA family protein [Stenotrophomonas geniculata]